MSAIQKLVEMLKKKGAPSKLQGIGEYGPRYNPGTQREFQPGPMPEVPFMPQAQVGPQQIALGDHSMQPNLGLPSAGPRNPNNLPAYAPIPGQDANYNQAPGTTAGPAAGGAGKAGFGPEAIQAYLKILGSRQAPQPAQWIPMQGQRWGQ